MSVEFRVSLSGFDLASSLIGCVIPGKLFNLSLSFFICEMGTTHRVVVRNE